MMMGYSTRGLRIMSRIESNDSEGKDELEGQVA